VTIIPPPNEVGLDSHEFSSTEERLSAAIARYRPSIPDQYWHAVKPFVYDIMAAAGPRLSDESARATLSVLVRFSVWVWQSSGHELNRELIFDDALIEQFFAQLGASLAPDSLGTYRSRIRFLQKLLHEVQGDARGIDHLGFYGAKALAPYSDKELIGFRSWARGQNTHSRRRDASVLLATGVGAGLSTEDLVRLTTDDVLIDSQGVMLSVSGRRARQVPVLAEWEQAIIDAVNDIGPGLPLFGVQRSSYNNNAVSSFVLRSSGKGPKPLLPRLRATWICYHLRKGTPILSLRKAAGIQGLERFDRYLQYLEDPEMSEYRHTLRSCDSDDARLDRLEQQGTPSTQEGDR